MMARAARKDLTAAEPEQDTIVDRVRADPIIVLTDEDVRAQFLVEFEKDAMRRAGGDVSTATGRDKIKAAAFDVSRLKETIDKAGKAQTEEWRAKVAVVNAQRTVVKESMESIRDRVRAPATAWETREANRKAEADALLDKLRSAATVTIADTVESVQARLDDIRGINLSDELLGLRTEMAVGLRDDAVKALQDALEHLRQIEADRAEAARLRAEQERRDAEDAERRRAEMARQEAARKEKEDADRIARERADAERRAIEEAEAKAIREREDAERRHQEEIAAANERVRQAEEAARLERERTEREREEAAARQAEQEAAQRRREADEKHRKAVRTKVKEAIMTCGADEETARKIVLAMQAKEIPHVELTF